MADIFAGLLGAYNAGRQGEIEGQQRTQGLQFKLAQVLQDAKRRGLDEERTRAEIAHLHNGDTISALGHGFAPRGEISPDGQHPAIQLGGQWYDYNPDLDPKRVRLEDRLKEIEARGKQQRLTRQTPSASRTSTTGETAAHRETRQNFYANAKQIQSARSDLGALDKVLQKPLPLMATATDSAARRRLEAQRPSLVNRLHEAGQLGDSLAAAMRGDYSVPGHLPQAAPGQPNPGQQPQSNVGPAGEPDADAYARAATAYKQALSTARTPAEREQARQRYDRLVRAISQRHGPVRL